MSLSGQWILDETTGSDLVDSSSNSSSSTTGTTNGTLSGEQGVFLTESQTINLPIQLSLENSIGIFLFLKPTLEVSGLVVLSNSSGSAVDSLTIGTDGTGTPYVSHLDSTITGKNPIELASETHVGYAYDHNYGIQYLYINGSITSTRYADTSSTANNANTLTLGSLFTGYIRGVHVYSGVVQSRVPEGLATERDPDFILPSGTVYASRVEASGDVVHNGTIFRNRHLVSSTSSTTSTDVAHYAHDETTGEVNQTSSIQHRVDDFSTGSQSGTISLRVRDVSQMNAHVEITPGETRIGYGDGVSTIDVSGLRFNSDSAGLYFGENQEFRIVMIPDTPPRLGFQSYDSSTSQYVTKYSIVNR